MDSAQAYKAMIEFLGIYYARTSSDDVGALLGGMQLLEDGKPMDQALWQEWLEALARAGVESAG